MNANVHPSHELAAYALGSLDAEAAARVEEHLAGCSACRAEHARLLAVHDVLELAGGEAFAEPDVEDAPERLEEAVVERYRAAWTRRRPQLARRRALGLAAAAGAAAALAVVALAGGLGGDDARTVRLAGPAGAAEAELRWRDAVVQVRLRSSELQPTRGREVYELWFVSPEGRVSAGTFRVAGDGRVDLRLAAAPPAGTEQLGVTLEPDDADPARNGEPVLGGRL